MTGPTIEEFSEPNGLEDPVIRDRAKQTRVVRSRQFAANLDGVEAGYMSIDMQPAINVIVLYDLLVLLPFRRRGIGGALVAKAEEIARAEGFEAVRLSPRAFDGSVDGSWLKRWYEHRGYKEANGGTTEYEKVFVQ